MSNTIKPVTFGSSIIGVDTARKKALQLINTFKADKSIPARSAHYYDIRKEYVSRDLKRVISGSRLLSQERSSLCGPAAFFFTITRSRPDIYVKIILELYTNGKTTLEKLKLESSPTAKKQELSYMRGIDWMILSSIKPYYGYPTDPIAGITLPEEMKGWLLDAGYNATASNTSYFLNKSLNVLLNAQRDYSMGYTIFLFVDANVFMEFNRKTGKSFFVNHWVVLNSNIRIKKFDSQLKNHGTPTIITRPLINKILKETEEYEDAMETFNDASGFKKDEPIEIDNQIVLDVFSWGERHRPAYSNLSKTRNAKVGFFLKSFYGYVKAKR